MSRSLLIQIHTLLAVGVCLGLLAALVARRGAWRRHHAHIGRASLGLVLASGTLALVLAAASRNVFGVLFMLQAMTAAAGAWVQLHQSRLRLRGLVLVQALVSIGVIHGATRLLQHHSASGVVAFFGSALLLAAFAWDDAASLRQGRLQRRPVGHALRMLYVGWMYVAELCIFVFDPHPSLIAWAAAALPFAWLAWRIGRARGRRV